MKVNNQPDIQPAQRLDSVQEYYFSRKGKEVARMNAEGKDIISLAIGSPDMPPSQQTIDTLCREAQNPNAHGYQPTVGIPQLREAMADFYKRWFEVDLDPQSEIQPLIGSKEGILHVTLAFVNPGDKVLVPNPGYPTYTSLSRLLDASVSDICEKYTFEYRNPQEMDDTVLYAEPTLQGNAAICKRQEGEQETQMNLELLFNAVINKKLND